jgi:hypothetical protein
MNTSIVKGETLKNLTFDISRLTKKNRSYDHKLFQTRF